MGLPNPGMDFTAFDPLTADQLDNLVENIEALAAGTGLDDNVITPDKLDLNPQTAIVTTSQSLTNTSYTDLTTTGPSVTVVVPASGKVLISIHAEITAGSQGNTARASYAMSGANTAAASDSTQPSIRNGNTGAVMAGGLKLLTGLTPGSTVFTLKYRSGPSGSATFGNRQITVIPIA